MPRSKYILFHRKISWELFREIFNQFLDHWASITIKLFLKDCQNDPAIFRKEYMPRNTSLICNTKNLSVRAGDARDVCLIPESGRSPGEGNGNPLQYSCLGNPMDRGAWWAMVHGISKRV